MRKGPSPSRYAGPSPSRKGRGVATNPLAISSSPLAGEGKGKGDTPAKGFLR
jgi:hypothetical protein